jgi:hypothetical protein
MVDAIAATDFRLKSDGRRRQNGRSNATFMGGVAEAGAPFRLTRARILKQCNVHRVFARLHLSQIKELNFLNMT